MMRGITCRVMWVWTVLTLVAAGGLSSTAQQPTGDQTTLDEQPHSEALREQTIYIPFDRLEHVFERPGRGVFLPYEKFQELWRAAQAATRPPRVILPPTDAVIRRARTEAWVEQDVLVARAELEIDLLKNGWHRVPLGLHDAAVRSARIENQTARIVPDPQNGVVLLYEAPAQREPFTVRLEIEYAKAVEKIPGRNTVALHPPRAPINEWRVTVPESAVTIAIHPSLAATTESPMDSSGAADRTVLHAFVGPADEVRIEWNPQAERAAGVTTLATAEAQQELFISEAAIRCRTYLEYMVSGGELPRLQLRLPATYRVVGIFDANVKQWQTSTDGPVQHVSVELFEPARSRQTLIVELERFGVDPTAEEFAAPMVEALDAGRQQGIVAVQLGEALRGATRLRNGLVQVDSSELPDRLKSQNWHFAFRYVTLPYQLSLGLEKVSPEVTARQYAQAYIDPRQLVLTLFAVFDIQQSGLFQIQITAPPGWQPLRVEGQSAPGIEAVQVESVQPASDQPDVWVVQLGRKAIGQVGLRVEWQRTIEEPNLVSPTGQPTRLELVVPRIETAGLHRLNGFLIIRAPVSLRVVPTAMSGLHVTSLSEAAPPDASVFRPMSEPVLGEGIAFAHGAEPARVELLAERRKPQVDVRQLLNVQVQPGLVRHEAKFFFEVRYSPVKTLRIDLPSRVAAKARNVTSGVRDEVIDPQPSDVAANYVAWQFTGDREFFAHVLITLVWEEPLAALEIGQTVTLNVPFLKPVGVDRSWGQVLLSRNETIDVEPARASSTLREIDPRHDLMPGAEGAGVSHAFEFHEPYELSLAATRFEPLDLKRTEIQAALVRAVATRSGQLDVQALFRIQSVRQRLGITFPPSVDPKRSFDAEPVRINDRAVPLEQVANNQFQIPLVSVPPGTPFLLEVRYSIHQASRTVELPSFPEEPAIGKVYLSVYLPEDQVLWAVEGPWTDEQPDVWESLWLLSPRTPSDEEIFRDIIAGDLNIVASALTRFSVQGRRHLYSTLQPEGSPKGSLRWQSMDERLYWGGVFATAILVALVFLAQPLRHKLAVLALGWVLVIATAIFAPTASRQLLDPRLQLTASAVLGVWLVAEGIKAGSAGRSLVRRWRVSNSASRQQEGEPSTASAAQAELQERIERVLDAWQTEPGERGAGAEPAATVPSAAATSDSPPQAVPQSNTTEGGPTP